MNRWINLAGLLLACPLLLAATGVEENPEAHARRLINALGCKGCHRIQGDGGSLAPDLDQIGSRMTKQQIIDHLAAHADSRKRGFMPSYHRNTEDELQAISDFLYNLRE